MNFSPQQDAALSAVRAWLEDPSQSFGPVFRLFGYAGTGKTTLARHFASSCDGLVQFAAFTGKAASVMRSKGCANATTIHSLIYRPRPKSAQYLIDLREELKGELTPERRKHVEEEIARETSDLKKPSFVLKPLEDLAHVAMFVIDECSMVDEKMANDLLSFDKPILVLGDPAQLPPVYGAGYFTEGRPNVMLTEIHRQAAESPIIRLATDVREGRSVARGEYGTSRVIRKADLAPGEALAHDQILVGRNATRKAANRRARQLKGLPGLLPVPGDRLVCLRNNHDIGILNGQIWTTHAVETLDEDLLALTIEGEGLPALTVEAHRHHFEDRELGVWEKLDADEFDYGYALTVHKAQGSQWGSVILFDESYCFREQARRWLYTGLTRAADRVTVVTS